MPAAEAAELGPTTLRELGSGFLGNGVSEDVRRNLNGRLQPRSAQFRQILARGIVHGRGMRRQRLS